MPKKPVMLLYHPGGFVFGDPSSMTAAKRRARKAGFAARAVDYGSGRMPLGRQTKRAFKEAKRLNRKGREVYAYGESAGGLIASRLAQKGLAKGAAVQAPVANLPKFLEDLPGLGGTLGVPTRKSQQKYSPSKYRSRSKILAYAPREDSLSPATQKWAKRDPRVKVKRTSGGHLANRDQTMNTAMRWLARQRKT